MANYRRRKTYGRRPYRKRSTKRAYRKRWSRSSRYKRGQKIYLYKRLSGFYATITVGSISPTLQAFEFRLNQVPNYTEFTALYDQYKINAVKITFLPEQTQSVSLSTANNATGSARFFSVVDYNDSAAPSSIDQLREYQSCKFTSIFKPHKRYFKPRILDSSGIYNPGRPWLSTQTGASITHYALKIGIEPTQATVATVDQFTVEVKYYLSFRTVK